MYLEELFEAKMAWGRIGKKLVRRYRCTSGRRKGRVVASAKQCFAAPDIKKRFRLKCLKRKLVLKLKENQREPCVQILQAL